MGLEEKLPSGVLLTTVEGVAGYMRKASFWPATFGTNQRREATPGCRGVSGVVRCAQTT